MCQLMQVDPLDVAALADLPQDVHVNDNRTVTTAQYFSAWRAGVGLSNVPELVLKIGQSIQSGGFSSALFAMDCSPNFLIGVERMSIYKILIGPMTISVTQHDDYIDIVLGSIEPANPLPSSLAAMEMAHLMSVLRTQTDDTKWAVSAQISTADAYPFVAKFIGCDITESPDNAPASIRISKADALEPFSRANPNMWSVFEPNLRQRLANLENKDTIVDRVSAVLAQLLPLGQASVDAVADRLNVSKRSLQRSLASNGTKYQTVLDGLRHELALHYLADSKLSLSEISYLLGFDEPNSFFKAFHKWTQKTPSAIRNELLELV